MNDQRVQQMETKRLNAKCNVRKLFDEEKITGLSQSYTEVGQQQPILVDRNGNIIDGERRYRAALKAGLKTVGVIVVEEELTAADVLHRQLVTGIHQADLTALEKGRGAKALMTEKGWSASVTASKLGVSNASLTRFLALLELPIEIQLQIESGQISASVAYELAHVTDPAHQAELAQQVAQGLLTRDGVTGAVKRARNPPASGSAPRPARVTAILGEDCSVTVSSAGLTLDSLIEFLGELRAKALKAQQQNLELGTFIKMLRDQAKA